jgi:hypothetical protein
VKQKRGEKISRGEKKEKEEEKINKKRNIFLAYSSHFIYLYI